MGHLAQLVRRPLDFLREAQACGEVVTIHLGTTKAYFVNQPDTLRAMLVTDHADYDKGVHFDSAKVVIGDSLPVSSGAFHRRQRKLIKPAFQSAMLRDYFEIMRECATAQMDTWTSGTDLHAALRDLVGTITVRALYSVESAVAATVELAAMIDSLESGVTRRVLDPTGLLEKLPLPANRRFEEAIARTRALVTGFIEESRRAAGGRRDLLSILLAARDGSEGMSDVQLRDEAVAMMQAGVETTAQVLRWTCHALSEHPEIQQRVRQETDDVLAGREITFDDVDELAFTRRVLLESLRMYPPLYFMSRRAIRDVQVGGHTLPAGSMVLFSAYAVQRDPRLYRDPDTFDPDRWLTGEPPPVSYLPFGAGLRSCIGERFAMIEMLTVLGSLAQRFTIRRDRSVPVRPKATFILSVGAKGMTLEPRV